jgi:hypothetical protein
MNNFLKIKLFLFFLCGITILYSCQQQSERHLSVSKIEADMASNAELKLSEYFENFRMLKLPSDTVMGEIKRIRYENGSIYISDGNTLFVFSDTGILLTCFNKTGKGPGEYTIISDFTVNGETITILCRSLRKLMDYNHSGECISTRNIEYWARTISPVVGHSYFLYCGNEYGDNERHKVRRVNNGQEDSMYLAIDRNQAKYLHISSEHNFYRHQECVYFFEAFNDTVYRSVDGGGIKPYFCIDYNGKNIPESFFKRKYTNVANFFQEFHKTSYAYGILNFAMYDRFVMFNSFYQKNIKLTVFDQKDRITNTFASVKDNIYFNGLTIPISEFSFHADKHIFVPLDALAVVEWKNAHIPADQFREMINATKEEDNPLLLIFDFKQ